MIDPDLGQRLLMPLTTERIAVLRVDQFFDCVLPVADDYAGRAFARGNQFVVDHQQPVAASTSSALTSSSIEHCCQGSCQTRKNCLRHPALVNAV